jgi:glyoxylase-like metal-dependent hydrolase (beta-lactamase superfamily II)
MSVRIWSVLGNSQKLDGGAMFGNAPRALWQRWLPPDDDNRVALACRALLVREPNRLLLFETGIGAFFAPELRQRYGVVEDRHVLLDSLGALGIEPDAVDVVMLSHLHFDHAGGLLTAWRQGEAPRLAFRRARFVVGRVAFDRAKQPHPRDRASFVPELVELLERSGRLEIVDGERSATLGNDYRFHASNGHTPGMLCTEIPGEAGPIVFAADLVPGLPWVRRAITMGYDRYPELLIDEKTRLLEDLVQRGGRLFYTHDPGCALSRLARDAKGAVVPVEPRAELVGEAA